MIEILVSVLLLVGAAFMVLAAIGVLRLPDLPTRMHATTKAGALGAMMTMGGVAFYFGDSTVAARAVAIVIFIFLTAPIAAHVIGRAGYFTGTNLELPSSYEEVKALWLLTYAEPAGMAEEDSLLQRT